MTEILLNLISLGRLLVVCITAIYIANNAKADSITVSFKDLMIKITKRRV